MQAHRKSVNYHKVDAFAFATRRYSAQRGMRGAFVLPEQRP